MILFMFLSVLVPLENHLKQNEIQTIYKTGEDRCLHSVVFLHMRRIQMLDVCSPILGNHIALLSKLQRLLSLNIREHTPTVLVLQLTYVL